ncbi:1-deoxy-D-xylulose-5-phosphate synthase [Wolinella succinogenes]|uniref:1-deoxy-D-xylulose-5-phosphate synthase n=1 Tax=Wolinella succinogenes (strain ATCC 29543 / DSM 1740 / CCUG 13145 / JCM 31913 / LMG 7466 / NCTC 11488 / FDC 602W) TaxID=273121 RepID=DXS_WOLSU|nr:1-deoxy-D-xylulose-5-phosphate synthase [Wolinella succinogenes]Q7M7Z0.1 RecName: Full=1-deoxy-D-xylulose-5-phosphate synthase; AltName: Full=1-deoxyxylulose-5-phosphate synthase; Short=DXP synthase; Short=DXPS [Wolinella succinogenes DSM 1740]CAE10998.1 1-DEOXYXYLULOSE-5-PHOSPHATE SYNTHASE [Wolinella succinogenes]VEG81160.1 1-deoxy-D-xylulose-5-phosphate synthase [Wolinella succinogenes]HCZ19054.1 1-deoxy-D-xylulose-5-phosphate synthase [Helicobacter sp.]
MNLKGKTLKELEEVSLSIRERILEVVSHNGGHLSSTLGAVELIVGMHAVFDSSRDPFIFDVSHQAYAHKLLTGRWEEFATLRQFEGVSGFTKPSESEHDYFIAGHSSTSISLAVGAAKAISLSLEKNRMPVVLIGDGSMSAGLCYEALNELGDRKYPMVILLNDNEMSIAEPIGAISKYLSQAIAGRFFQSIKGKVEKLLAHLPEGASYMAKRFEESLKLITPGILFEELGLEYIGPIDGHNLKEIIETLRIAKAMNKPVIIHAQTLKGKGYKIAEGPREHWHGVGPFDLSSGEPLKKPCSSSPTDIFSRTLLELAKEDEKVVGVTAAMPSGTGLSALVHEFPNRFWDVAIAEQHAVTSMAALAKEGYKPFVAIYSTFLQRAYDQIIHDVGIMKLPVKFAIDRGGIVGEDGETHQGILDIGYLRLIPHMTLMAPRSNESLKEAVKFAKDFSLGPIAFRYPRKSFVLQEGIFSESPFLYGKAERLMEGKDEVLFVGFGNGVGRAYEVSKVMASEYEVGLVDLRFVKPLDHETLWELSKEYRYWLVFSDASKVGGVASALLEWKAEVGAEVEILSMELEDEYIQHGKVEQVEEEIGFDVKGLSQKVRERLERIANSQRLLV